MLLEFTTCKYLGAVDPVGDSEEVDVPLQPARIRNINGQDFKRLALRYRNTRHRDGGTQWLRHWPRAPS